MTTSLLSLGVVTGAVYVGIALMLRGYTRTFLIVGLLVAALNYIAFAHVARAGHGWLLTEVAGLVVYGTFALCAARGSMWWLAAGWAMHALWDIGLHLTGPGRQLAPAGYGTWCLSLDLTVAAVLATRLMLASRRTRREELA